MQVLLDAALHIYWMGFVALVLYGVIILDVYAVSHTDQTAIGTSHINKVGV
jgi:hypothetical protein